MWIKWLPWLKNSLFQKQLETNNVFTFNTQQYIEGIRILEVGNFTNSMRLFIGTQYCVDFVIPLLSKKSVLLIKKFLVWTMIFLLMSKLLPTLSGYVVMWVKEEGLLNKKIREKHVRLHLSSITHIQAVDE